MKKIIVYILGSQGRHPTLEIFCKEIAAGFRALGEDVYEAYGDDKESMAGAGELLIHDQVKMSVGLNASGMDAFKYEGTEKMLYSNINFPHVSIMLDAPYNQFIGPMGSPCNKNFVCCLDKTHMSLFRKIFPEKKFWGTMFLPLGGITHIDEEEIFNVDRDIDILCATNTAPESHITRSWHKLENENNKHTMKILDDVADYLRTEAITIDEAVKSVLQSRGLYGQEYEAAILPYYQSLLWYIKMYRRAKSMEMLVKNDIQVTIIGSGWEETDLYKGPLGKNMNVLGPRGYNEVLELTGRAKIVYQDQAEFNNGAHDRVFSSMLSGAVVVSEYSSYLAEEFVPGQEIFLYDWKNGMQQVKVINELLSDESKRLAVAIRAYSKASKKHRWINRCQSILEAVELLQGRQENI